MLCCADISCKLAVLGSGSWSKINLLHSEDSFVSWWWSLKKIQQWKCGYLLYTYEWLDRIWLTSSKHRFPKQWILPVDKPKPHLVPCEVGTDSTFDLRSVWCYKVALHSIPENKEGQLTCTGHTETSVVWTELTLLISLGAKESQYEVILHPPPLKGVWCRSHGCYSHRPGEEK